MESCGWPIQICNQVKDSRHLG
ncbi:hypothetical protein NC653_015147 [Populus alba x Populus x berolinensis]|uniref:Uncharacterized protein n=1 Tax=Populus alba x Populus x berolinensis TaxID=444605 RepID=A0AAD6QYV0_9ROSI|nr:hypothetical protein NC653_015147 [Populus alba x Populus x berolinensis]